MSLRQHIAYYLFGHGGHFMFGNRLLACSAIVGCGIAAAGVRHDGKSIVRVELLLVSALFWLVPTLSPVKNVVLCSGFWIRLHFSNGNGLAFDL